MGFRAMQWAMQQEELTPMMHWVLCRIAWSVLDDTGVLDRSAEWLARKCDMPERSCRRHVLELEKLGLVCRRRSGLAIAFDRPPVAASGQNRHFEWPPVAARPTPPYKELISEKEEEELHYESEEQKRAYKEAVRRYWERETMKR